MAETADAIHVSFLGTKLGSDHLTNLNLRYQPLHISTPSVAGGAAAAAAEDMPPPGFDWEAVMQGGFPAGVPGGQLSVGPAAHRGYAQRAVGVPVEQMYRLAAVQGKRLVLSGELCAVKSSGTDSAACNVFGVGAHGLTSIGGFQIQSTPHLHHLRRPID
jgi:hypothetical protein